MRLLIVLIFVFSSILAVAQPGILWQSCFGGNGMEYPYSMIQTPDSGYIIAGGATSNNGDVTAQFGQGDFWIVKIDKAGALQWQKSYGGSLTDWAYSILQINDGGFVIGGRSSSLDGDVTGNNGAEDIWIIKIDSAGNLIWQNSFGGSDDDILSSMVLTSDSGYTITGYSQSADSDVTVNHGDRDIWILKLDKTGNLLWQTSVGGSNEDMGSSILQSADKGFLILGHTNSNDGDVIGNHGADYWIIKISQTGVLEWQKCIGGTGGEEITSMVINYENDLILCGLTQSNDGDVGCNHGSGSVDYWIIQLDDITSIDKNVNLKSKINISPNPSGTFVKISFPEISFNSSTSIFIMNMNGIQVKNMTNSILTDSGGNFVWDLKDNYENDVPNGVYFLTFLSNCKTVTEKIIVLR